VLPDDLVRAQRCSSQPKAKPAEYPRVAHTAPHGHERVGYPVKAVPVQTRCDRASLCGDLGVTSGAHPTGHRAAVG
jgi:hypothetical protein